MPHGACIRKIILKYWRIFILGDQIYIMF